MAGPSHEQTGFPRLEGELTIYSAAQQHARVIDALRQSGPTPGLDLANVKEIDTAGIQLLLMARNALIGHDGVLCLANTTAAVREVLGLLRLENQFSYVDGPSAAASADAAPNVDIVPNIDSKPSREPKRRKRQAK